MKGYTLSPSYKVYNDETGEFLTVEEDSDGLGLVQIRDIDQNICLTLVPDQARALIAAILKVIGDLEDN